MGEVHPSLDDLMFTAPSYFSREHSPDKQRKTRLAENGRKWVSEIKQASREENLIQLRVGRLIFLYSEHLEG